MIADRISQDLKQALLSKDAQRVTVLRGLRSVILYAEVAAGKREEGLDDAAIIALLQKEAKKRQESADLYQQGGDAARATAELEEKKIIEAYLPAALSDEEVAEYVDTAVRETGADDMKALGQVISRAKELAGGAADGATVARIAKERLGA